MPNQHIQIFKTALAAALLVLCACLTTLVSCKNKGQARTVTPAFYYWKSVLHISETELSKLDSLHVNTLYIKFFDADWNGAVKQPMPLALLQANNFRLPKRFNIIPTVFITNECIKNIDSVQAGTLAENIYRLVQDISNKNRLTNFKEVQIDCDWTASTRATYFYLLQQLGSLLNKVQVTVSATIRPHQVKFRSKTGVPPVQRGLLMCYNMGNLKNPATENSIIETATLREYTQQLASYPLPLDMALPLFEWKVLFRNQVYGGLINSITDSMLTNDIASREQNRFRFLKDTVLAGLHFKKGDLLRKEDSPYATLLQAVELISSQLKNTPLRVSLYHLDSVILKKYSLHELETVYNGLR